MLRPGNRARLKANGTVIYLHADPAVLWERVRHSRNRPLLKRRSRTLGLRPCTSSAMHSIVKLRIISSSPIARK